MVFVIVHTPWPISNGLDHTYFACLCLLASMLYAYVGLSSSRPYYVWRPQWVFGCVVTFDAYEALFGCNDLGCVFRCRVAQCIPFPFSALCEAMLTMLVCATCWLSVHLYMLAYMSMHKSCLLVCRPCFNTMTLWTSDPNLHFSLVDTSFCLLFLLVYLLACLLSFLFFACHVYHAYLLYVSFICTLHLFLPLLVCLFLVFAFACTHMERGRMELGHGLPGASKKGQGCKPVDISQVVVVSRFRSLASPIWSWTLLNPFPSSSLSLLDGLY